MSCVFMFNEIDEFSLANLFVSQQVQPSRDCGIDRNRRHASRKNRFTEKNEIYIV